MKFFCAIALVLILAGCNSMPQKPELPDGSERIPVNKFPAQ